MKIVGVCGGSGSGKSYLAMRLAQRMKGASHYVLAMDHYYRDQGHLSLEERKRLNFDHPDTVELDLLALHLQTLRAGQAIQRPTYDFVTHTRTTESDTVAANGLILVDGILVCHSPRVRECLDLAIFVDAPGDIRLARRITRDLEERGRDLAGILQQYVETVGPMHEAFVEPQRRVADIVVVGTSSMERIVELFATFAC